MTNLPVSNNFSITAVYGQAGTYWKNGHKGIDFVSDDKIVYSTCEGVVRVIAYDKNGWGNYVSIGDADGRRHIFCHLENGSIAVKEGEQVSRTTRIGIMGDTGNVTGVHLHFELHDKNNIAINPSTYLGVPNKKGSYNSSDFKVGDKMYNDENQISDWAKADVIAVTQAGLMLGDDKGNFNPKKSITREEVAVILARLLKKEQ